MTTYAITGLTINFADNEVAGSVETGTELSLFSSEYSPSVFSYTTATGIDGNDIADISASDEWLLGLNGEEYPDLTEEFILEVVWDDNGTTRTTIVFGFDELYETGSGEDYANRMHVFVLGGDDVPNITTAAEWEAFDDSIISTRYPTGSFAPNQNITLSEFFETSTENDEVIGTSGDDVINSGDGDDEIYGNGGNDFIDGSAGEDWIVLDAQDATVAGGDDFDDLVIEDSSNNEILVQYLSGNDGTEMSIYGMAEGQDTSTAEYTVDATEIERVVLDVTGDVRVEGNAGNNRIRLNELPASLIFNGDDGTDQVDLHRTWVEDDEGNDVRGISLEFFLENARLEGTSNSLSIYDVDDNSLIAELNDVEFIRFSDRTMGIDEVLAMALAGEGDEITGTDARDTITGTDDNDTITGGAGHDTVSGGSGSDIIDGGTGGDSIHGDFGDDTILGDTSTDILFGDEGNDSISGGTGDDTIHGGDGNDRLFGNTSLDTIFGGAGDDYISSGDGVDYVEGGAGEDTIYGRSGWDTLFGGDGDDSMYGSEGDDELSGGTGDDWVSAGSAWDIVYGNSGDDTLYGNFGSDILSGSTGEDMLYGGTGDDTLSGGADDDSLYGNQGVDRLEGGGGDDLLRGGTLADTFVFDTGHDADEINDFEISQDRLELSSALVDGLTDGQEVLDRFAGVDGGVVVFDFGGGDEITISNLTSLNDLSDNIFIV